MISKFHGPNRTRGTTDDAWPRGQDDKEKLTEMIREIPFMHLCRDGARWGYAVGSGGSKHATVNHNLKVLFCSVILLCEYG